MHNWKVEINIEECGCLAFNLDREVLVEKLTRFRSCSASVVLFIRTSSSQCLDVPSALCGGKSRQVPSTVLKVFFCDTHNYDTDDILSLC